MENNGPTHIYRTNEKAITIRKQVFIPQTSSNAKKKIPILHHFEENLKKTKQKN